MFGPSAQSLQGTLSCWIKGLFFDVNKNNDPDVASEMRFVYPPRFL
jgi:hypothetical protein